MYERLTHFLAYDDDGVEYVVSVFRESNEYCVRFRLRTSKGDSIWPVLQVDDDGEFEILIGADTLKIRSSNPAAFEDWARVIPH